MLYLQETKVPRAIRISLNIVRQHKMPKRKTENSMASHSQGDIRRIESLLEEMQRVGFARCRVYTMSSDGSSMRGTVQRGTEWPTVERFSDLVISATDPVFATERPRIVRASQLDGIPDTLRMEPDQEWIDVPLMAGNQVLGKLSIDNLVPGETPERIYQL